MTLQLLYFAGVAELVGQPSETLTWPEGGNATVQELSVYLCERFPRLILHGVRFAVNEEFVSLDHRLASGDVVALIPPVSGG